MSVSKLLTRIVAPRIGVKGGVEAQHLKRRIHDHTYGKRASRHLKQPRRIDRGF